MKCSDEKKMAMLKVLQEKSEPFGIHDLLHRLPNDFAERSVRRWLAELIKAKLVEKTGKKRSTKYYYSGLGLSPIFNPIVDSLDFGATDIPLFVSRSVYATISFRLLEEADRFFSEASLRIIAKVRQPAFARQPVFYNDYWLEKYKPNRSFYLPLQIRAELSRSGKQSKDADPAGSYALVIFNRLLIDLSYNSSRLEGNTYSLLETEKLLLEGTGAQNKSESDKIMILNHKEAIRYLVDSALKLQVSKEAICTIHYLLSDALVESHYAGTIRNHEVRVGGSVYTPYADFKKLQKQLKLITKKAALIKDAYEQSFFLLIHLSYLQAFSDANKRTARLSANIPLIKNNLVPLSFNDVGSEDYTSAMMAVYELQNIQPMIDLYLFSYKRTCALYASTIHSMGVNILRVRYRNQRRQLISEIILGKKIGPSIETYIQAQAKELIPEKDRSSFIEDLKKDLAAIDQH
ncbi:MAG: Fic family protein, partial [Rhabdochlamydiaceae bacterium]